MLKILTVPNSILTTKTEQIKKIDSEILTLIPKMLETCRTANGIGLAAPQIGRSVRMCIINLEHLGIPPFALINPKITKKSWRKVELEEGCLSIPGVYGIVRRPKKITVEAQNEKGELKRLEADEMLSRVIQHEVDHLDGILFTSKMRKKTDGAETTNRRNLNE
jgi:peptide deformylase